MKNEYKAALALLAAGVAAISFLYLKKQSKTETQKNHYITKDQKIIIPDIGSGYENIKEVKDYLKELQELYKEGKTVLPLDSSELDDNGKIAQDLALKNKEFLSDTKIEGKILHNDIMRAVPVSVSMLDEKTKKECKESICYAVEKYNYVLNSTKRAIVDVKKRKVLAVKNYPNMQPDISVRLTNIAKAIALKNSQIIKDLGHTPTPNEISMPNVRTNFENSPCEEKNHLCVAPTFPQHEKQRALWAIVDLTKLKLVAAKWAGLGKTYTPACIDERELENRYIVKNFCQKDTKLQKDGWSMVYHLTGSDGLEIRDIKFKGHKVAKSLKVVDWHVAYKGYGADKLDTSSPTVIEGRQVEFVKGENNEYTFGYNDAMGCPMFSTSAVLAFNGPQVKDIVENNKTVGFSIIQDFRNPKWPMACNYRYQNRFFFYKDGSFRTAAVSMGRGCSDKAIYRPVMRLDIDLDTPEEFSVYKKGSWQKFDFEGSYKASSKEQMFKGKYLYRFNEIDNLESGYYIEPNRGQFGDKSRGDHEHIFISKFKKDEGDEDLLTLGSCCKLNEDGPERFIKDKELIENSDTVLWYVPTIHNDNKKGHEYCWADSTIDEYGNPSVKIWPCVVGPKFVPISPYISK